MTAGQSMALCAFLSAACVVVALIVVMSIKGGGRDD